MGARLVIRLAEQEIRHNSLAAICLVASLVGLLVPMVIVLGLKNGLITGLVDNLINNPRNLSLISTGARPFEAAFFEQMSKDRRVRFVMPNVLAINTSANAVRNPETRDTELRVPLIPSTSGDPLLGELPAPQIGEAYVSTALAKKLGLEASGRAEIVIGRQTDGTFASIRRSVTVLGIVPSELLPREAVLLPLSELRAAAQYRADPTVSEETWLEAGAPYESYLGFRLYAADLASVGPLTRDLESMGYQVRPVAEDVPALLQFRSALNLLYALLVVLALAGFWAAMAANLRGAVERQRLSFAMLSVLSMPRRDAALFPVTQSVLVAGAGLTLTAILAAPLLVLVNSVFSLAERGLDARVSFLECAVIALVVIVVAISASIWAARAVFKIQTVEALRNA